VVLRRITPVVKDKRLPFNDKEVVKRLGEA
jgi:hypothetical protein